MIDYEIKHYQFAIGRVRREGGGGEGGCCIDETTALRQAANSLAFQVT